MLIPRTCSGTFPYCLVGDRGSSALHTRLQKNLGSMKERKRSRITFCQLSSLTQLTTRQSWPKIEGRKPRQTSQLCWGGTFYLISQPVRAHDTRICRDISRSFQATKTSAFHFSKAVNLLQRGCVLTDTQANFIFLFCMIGLLLIFPFLHYTCKFSDVLTQRLLEPGYVTQPLSSDICKQLQQMVCPGCAIPSPCC